jgi:4'-phosphopantetheinyl transferase
MGNGHGSAYVFLCRPESIVDAGLLLEYERLLDPMEKARFSAFRSQRDAHAYLVAHALLRAGLSHVFDVRPDTWRFSRDQSGRPGVEKNDQMPSFSLSRRQGLVAAMIVAGHACGVDVEEVRALDEAVPLADRFFAPSETAELRELQDMALLERFHALWTLKEAYMKARGHGLALPLDAISFQWDGDTILPSFNADMPHACRQWTFTLRRPMASYLLATALAAGPTTPPPNVVVHWLVPLIGLQAPHRDLSVDSPAAAL